MHQLLSVLRWVGHNPWLRLLAALVLLLSGVAEAVEVVGEELSVGVHHGAIAYGAAGVLKALPSALEGLMKVQEVQEAVHPDG